MHLHCNSTLWNQVLWVQEKLSATKCPLKSYKNVVLRSSTAERVVARGSSCCAPKAITSFVWWPYFPQTSCPLMPECVRQDSSEETKDSSDDHLWLQDPQTAFPNLPTPFLSLLLKVRLCVQLCWVSQPYPDPLPSSLTWVFLLKQSFPVESRLVCFCKGASWNLLSEPRRTQASLCLSTSMQESMSVFPEVELFSIK